MTTIERVSNLTETEFRRGYLEPGRPVVLLDAVREWSAIKNWSPEYLSRKYGRQPIQTGFQFEGSSETSTVNLPENAPATLGDFISRLQDQPKAGQWYLKQQRIGDFPEGFLAEIGESPLLAGQMSLTGHEPYFWIGPKGIRTGLHYDYTHNFAVQIWGHKRWWIYPKEYRSKLYWYTKEGNRERVFGSGEYPHHSQIGWGCDLYLAPTYEKVRPIEIVVNPGEQLFVPAG